MSEPKIIVGGVPQLGYLRVKITNRKYKKVDGYYYTELEAMDKFQELYGIGVDMQNTEIRHNGRYIGEFYYVQNKSVDQTTIFEDIYDKLVGLCLMFRS